MPSAGSVSVLDLDPVADRAAVRRRTGVLLQRSGFIADLSVRETLQMWAATVTGARPVDECLEMLDLTTRADTRMRALSGGEQRRVDLACTLMGRPEVVMLDEPTTGLDPESRRQVWRLIRDLQADGVTVLLTTHYLEEAEALSDRLSIMAAGRSSARARWRELVAGHRSTISFRSPDVPLLPLGTAVVTSEGGTTRLEVDDLQGTLTRALAVGRVRADPAGVPECPHRQPGVGVPRDRRRRARRTPTRTGTDGSQPMSTPTALAPATRRVLGLTRTNTTVLVRNRLNLFYAFVLPLLPLGLLFLGERGDVTAGIANVTLVLMMALVFPVYYNVLSMVVTRRDELVLKRLRTGEARDAEILLAIAAPGTAITLIVTMLTVPLGAAAGLPLPVNPLLCRGRGARWRAPPSPPWPCGRPPGRAAPRRRR